MATYTLTPGDDTIIATDAVNTIYAPSGTLSAHDVIEAPPGSHTTLVLQNGNQFDLTAPTTLSGISRIDDQSVGNTVISLRAGLDLTLQLGRDSATVTGAANADRILTGQGYATIALACSAESVRVGAAGATIGLNQASAGAYIEGGNTTVLRLSAAAGADISLGAGLTGVAELDVVSPGLTVAVGAAQIASVALFAHHTTLATGSAKLITDYSGGNAISFGQVQQTLRLPSSPLAGTRGEPADRLFNPQAGDVIAVGLPFGPGTSLSYHAGQAGPALTLASAAGHQTMVLPGGYAGGFQITPDRSLGTDVYGTAITLLGPQISVPAGGGTPEAPCFAHGTRLLTDRGPIAVEELVIGDRLVTSSGARRKIRWIGWRDIDCRHHPEPAEVQPICIDAHAFSPDRPLAPVVLSPDHAVLCEAGLIPVKYLVNGATIRRLSVLDVTYFHVELGSHDILLSEGLAVESYLDTGNRAQFANARAATRTPFWSRRPWATLLTAGPGLRATRAALLARAEQIGHGSTTEPDLHLLVDGRRVDGWLTDGIWTARLPGRTRSITICSRAAAPADCELDQDDRRLLGVALRRVVLRHPSGTRCIDAHNSLWTAGFYAPESDSWSRWRWTDGAATVPRSCWQGLRGSFLIELHLFRTVTYRLAPVRDAALALL